MYTMHYDRTNRVLLTRAAGLFTFDDLIGVEEDMAAFAAREGPVRFICDLSTVVDIPIPSAQLVGHAQKLAPLSPDQKIYVASDKLVFGLCRQYATHQRHAGNREPAVVESLDEAYRAFAISDPDFEPVQLSD
jgi:hypothetical protein